MKKGRGKKGEAKGVKKDAKKGTSFGSTERMKHV